MFDPSGASIVPRLAAALALALAFAPAAASAHDIYTGVRGEKGQPCCGGQDCAATVYRERGAAFEFLTREGRWVAIPAGRIVFLPIPGDPPASESGDSHRAHLCYRAATAADRDGARAFNVFDDIYLYCAFIPPGAT